MRVELDKLMAVLDSSLPLGGDLKVNQRGELQGDAEVKHRGVLQLCCGGLAQSTG
jgi:hypothetical protein